MSMSRLRSSPGFKSKIFRPMSHVAGVAAGATVLAICLAMGASAAPGEHADCRGRVVDTATGRDVSYADLARQLQGVDFVAFGERHGVRAHAAASACVLQMLALKRPAALVMEMLSVDDQPVIDAWRNARPESAGGLGGELQWWQRGWPAFDSWLPLLDRAFSLRVPVLGGDLPDGDQSLHASVIPEDGEIVLARLGPSRQAISASWERAMAEAHCGLAPPDQVEALAMMQIRRDFSIAGIARSALKQGGAVLIETGRGHARKDRSLVAVLGAEPIEGSEGVKRARVVSIGAFTSDEMVEDETTAAKRPLYDYVWIAGSNAQQQAPCSTDAGSQVRQKTMGISQ